LKLSDGFTATDAGLVTINVVDAPIVANDNRMESLKNSETLITADDLLKNCQTALTNASLQVIAVTAPANGQLTPVGAGMWTYTPASGFTGQDSFFATIFDGVNTATAKMTVFVQQPQQQSTVWQVPFATALELVIRDLNNNEPLTLPSINRIIRDNPNLRGDYAAALSILQRYVYASGDNQAQFGFFS